MGLEELADAWRRLQIKAETAQDTVNCEAHRVFSDEAWDGDTADAYDAHRSRLTGDIGHFAQSAGTMAQALQEVASTLRFNQESLERVRAGLAGIPVTENDESLTFHPEDDEQARRVTEGIAAARDFRERVDHTLVLKKTVFETAEADLRDISETWKPRTVRVLDLNIFQGGRGNEPWAPMGVDHRDIPELGQIILDNGADVATLQEAFNGTTDEPNGDMEELRRWLQENDDTGGRWELHFTEASSQTQYSDAPFLPGQDGSRFGNAILVRHGGNIASSEALPPTRLQEDESGEPEGRVMGGASIQLTDG